jgi:trans-aconitate methyltransferase
VLELGCGTGRNLDRIARRWPGMRLHGIDISREMLASARARLGKPRVWRWPMPARSTRKGCSAPRGSIAS